MISYEKMYHDLFNALTDALKLLETAQQDKAVANAIGMLQTAQQDAEEIYMLAEE